ncbi:MAG: class I SAM-dependent methyltransferase [Anaerolineales bacterium]|jgi:SAM-dependent methyltransferase
MSGRQVDYDHIASEYDQRFQHDTSTGIASALQGLLEIIAARRVLEVGCGTGHWLGLAAENVNSIFGLDLSVGMLRQAQRQKLPLVLIQGRAEELPFAAGILDLVYCVNAIHHFNQPEQFIQESARLLRPGGILAVFGSDPHHPDHQWYVYDYFDGTCQTDLDRFPSQERIHTWMGQCGFEHMQSRPAQWIREEKHGQEVLEDPFLSKEATSQLTLLSDDAYQTGLARIKSDLKEASASGRELVFRSTIQIFVTWGRLHGR